VALLIVEHTCLANLWSIKQRSVARGILRPSANVLARASTDLPLAYTPYSRNYYWDFPHLTALLEYPSRSRVTLILIRLTSPSLHDATVTSAENAAVLHMPEGAAYISFRHKVCFLCASLRFCLSFKVTA
jgi:hypothetical protein